EGGGGQCGAARLLPRLPGRGHVLRQPRHGCGLRLVLPAPRQNHAAGPGTHRHRHRGLRRCGAPHGQRRLAARLSSGRNPHTRATAEPCSSSWHPPSSPSSSSSVRCTAPATSTGCPVEERTQPSPPRRGRLSGPAERPGPTTPILGHMDHITQETNPSTVTIPAAYNGPDGIGNGGYSAGVLAARLSGVGGPAVRVTLRNPVPLERALHLTQNPDNDGLLLTDPDAKEEARTVAEAETADMAGVEDSVPGA